MTQVLARTGVMIRPVLLSEVSQSILGSSKIREVRMLMQCRKNCSQETIAW